MAIHEQVRDNGIIEYDVVIFLSLSLFGVLGNRLFCRFIIVIYIGSQNCNISSAKSLDH